MFYANINTKCFFGTSNIFFLLLLLFIFCVLLSFFILFNSFFFLKFLGLNHNGSYH